MHAQSQVVRRPAALALLFIALGCACLAPGFAQSSPALAEKPDNLALNIQPVKTGLFLISGGGGNSLLRLSANGLIVVDGKLPGTYEALRARLNRISEQPTRVLINTDYRDVHTGTNVRFLEAGARIVAQQNTAKYLPDYNLSGSSISPIITYDRDYIVRLGGVEARLLHYGNAHSGGDTVVYFPNLRVVAVGDLFAANPDPDFLAGGSLVGWGPVLAEILKLDFDVVVPGTGPLLTRSDLEAFKDKMDALVQRASALVRTGIHKDRLMAQLKTDDLGWQFDFTSEQLDRFYEELSAHLESR
jgi:cyclase